MKRKHLLLIIATTVLTTAALTSFIPEHDRHDGSGEAHDHIDLYHEHTHSPGAAVGQYFKLSHPSPEPDRVILNLTATPETAVAVNWRTDTTVLQGRVEWAVAGAGPDFVSSATKVTANMQALRVQHDNEPKVSAHYFSAIIEQLTPGKKYAYRVGTDDAWSEWYQFTMPHPNKLSFVYFGDAQNDVKSMWSRVIREAYRTTPQVDFMLHAGDLINRHDRDIEWGEWFYAGNFIHAMVPSVMTPGNHEYGKGVVLSPHWRPQFNLPINGPKGLEEVCYAINYSQVKVISLDAEQIDESPGNLEKQRAWLDSVLTNDPRKWTVITFHYPVFSTSPKRDNEKLRTHFKPLFDKHRVDIVLQGHDHAYGRGMVNNVPTGFTAADKTSGTMYVVSVSGPKMYDVSKDAWMDRRARNTQLFQIITIEDNKLKFEAYSADGTLYDAFDLLKSAKKPNKLVNRIPAVKERL
jgi:hypothetical protein